MEGEGVRTMEAEGIGTMHILWKERVWALCMYYGRRACRHYACTMEGERVGTMLVLWKESV